RGPGMSRPSAEILSFGALQSAAGFPPQNALKLVLQGTGDDQPPAELLRPQPHGRVVLSAAGRPVTPSFRTRDTCPALFAILVEPGAATDGQLAEFCDTLIRHSIKFLLTIAVRPIEERLL